MTCPLLELCTSGGTQIYLFYLQMAVLVVAMLLGIVLIWQTKRVIEIQIAFYRFINWKMEPISMAREIRNTRTMGAAILIFAVVTLIYIILQR